LVLFLSWTAFIVNIKFIGGTPQGHKEPWFGQFFYATRVLEEE
jgi:hypothetical protein